MSAAHDPPGDDDPTLGFSRVAGRFGVDDTLDGPTPTSGADALGAEGTPDDPGGISLLAGRYRTLGLVGTGATGRVYRAHDAELDEVVALKVLRAELIDAPDVVERFRREVKLARRVTHPHVARTYDIGEHLGHRFLTMQFVDGTSLRQIIRHRAPLPIAEAIALARMICAGLGAAHAAGIVHRDLKPDNILVDTAGRALITDFGIAHAISGDDTGAAARLLVGTPAYMAPEQVQGLVEPDGRADLYAMGAILFEMLTGKRAWPGRVAVEVATARLHEPAPDPRAHRPGLPPALADLVLACLARQPAGRPPTAAALDAALAALAARLVDEAPAPLEPGPTATGTESGELFETVAVLPFDVEGDGESEYLAEGITEDIIDTLSMTPGLRVRPLSAVQPHAGTDPRAAGRALAVSAVVSGKLRRLGDQLRIRTRVLSVEDGFQLWAGRFRCAVGEVLDVSDRVAVAVAAALTVDARPEAAAVHGAADNEAIDLFLQARHAMRRHWHEDVRGAITLFDEALRRAPDDARILAGAAVARARMGFLGTWDGDRAVVDRAVDLAARAIAAAPARSEPYFAMAMVRFNRGEPRPAVAMLERAIERAPGDVDAHDLLGRIVLELGPIDRAIEHLRTALLLDPTSYNTRWDLVRAHALAGEWARAHALVALPVEDVQRLWVRAITRARLDMWSPEPRWLDAELPPDGGALMDPVIQMYRAVQRTREVTAEQHAQIARYVAAASAAPRRAVLMHQFGAELCGYVGDRERALDYVEAAVAAGLTDLVWLSRCPLLADLAETLRFVRLHAAVTARLA